MEIEVSSPPIEFDIEIETPAVDITPGSPGETVALVIVSGSGSGSGGGVGITGGTLTGLRNGVNKVFTTAFNFIAGSTAVYLNGLRESHYVESASNAITFDDAPLSADSLTIDYLV